MSLSPVILVLDLGLTNCKSVLFSATGAILQQASATYPTHYSGAGHVEQNPAEWWRAVVRATRVALAAQPELAGQIEAITITGHMHALVAVASGNALGNAIILGDQRSVASARHLTRALGLSTIYQTTGARMEEAMPAAKIHWLRMNEPERFHRSDLFTGCKDYIRGRLTGDRLTDPIDACAMSLYDLHSGAWSDDLLDAVGITATQLPEICAPTSQAGTLQPEAAAVLGLQAGIPVVVGSGDDVEVLGSGLMTPGSVKEHLGTTGSILACAAEPAFDEAMALEVYPHAAPGLWVVGGSITAAGGALAWAAEILGYDDPAGALAANVDLDRVAAESALLFVPHLSGERCPSWNPRVRGTWTGLSATDRRANLMSAAFEGTAYALNSILRRIDALIGRQERVVVVQRASDNASWLQLRANTYGRPIGVLNTQEPTALGAMILGAVGTAVYPDLEEAVATVSGVASQLEPDSASQALLAGRYDVYEELQTALQPVWDRLHAAVETGTADGVVAEIGQTV